MSTSAEQSQQATPFNTKPLWAAVGILSVSVLALGAALVHVKTKPAEPMITEMAEPAQAPKAGELAALAAPALLAAQQPAAGQAPVNKVASKPAANNPRPVARAPAAKPTQANSGESAPLPTQRVAQREICATCGTVEAVTPITRKGQASGVGAVGGAVLGGVLGHQVGSGRGNDLATVVGAVGGGVIGHQVERNVKKTTVYQVRVRMEDGSTRTIEQASAPSVGSKVTVNGNKLQSADGGSYTPAAPQQQAAQPVMVQNRY